MNSSLAVLLRRARGPGRVLSSMGRQAAHLGEGKEIELRRVNETLISDVAVGHIERDLGIRMRRSRCT